MVESCANFNVPPTVIVGQGARLQLANQIKKLGSKRALIVTDRYMVESGKITEFQDQLNEAHIEAALFCEVQPDPTVSNVNAGLERYRDSGAEIVVGIGGGSPMDAAKAISILTKNEQPLSKYMGYHKIPKPGCPLILIPTTAGTGSEVTKVTVITDTERNVKMMILDQYLQADVALVDYELSMSMPPELTAHVGVDTLSHGIEAYISRKSSPLTNPIALSCIRLCGQFLERAYQDGTDKEAREGMMYAALQGGMAFSNSSVCMIHGMSRPLGAHFHLTHGLSNAILLPEVTRFSLDAAKEKYAEVARVLKIVSPDTADADAAESLVSWLEHLNKQCGIQPMRELVDNIQIYEEKLTEMAEAALNSGSPNNNPRIPTAEQIVQIYRTLW